MGSFRLHGVAYIGLFSIYALKGISHTEEGYPTTQKAWDDTYQGHFLHG